MGVVVDSCVESYSCSTNVGFFTCKYLIQHTPRFAARWTHSATRPTEKQPRQPFELPLLPGLLCTGHSPEFVVMRANGNCVTLMKHGGAFVPILVRLG